MARLARMIGHPELGDNPAYAIGPLRANHAAELDKIIVPILKQRTAAEWFERALELKIPLVVIPDMKTLFTQDFHRERRAFGDISIGGATSKGRRCRIISPGPCRSQMNQLLAGADNGKPLCLAQPAGQGRHTHATPNCRSPDYA